MYKCMQNIPHHNGATPMIECPFVVLQAVGFGSGVNSVQLTQLSTSPSSFYAREYATVTEMVEDLSALSDSTCPEVQYACLLGAT